MKTYQNPILADAADPWIIRDNGRYYFITSRAHALWIYCGDTLSGCTKGEPVKILSAKDGDPYSATQWAPELHKIDGKWYVYFSGDDGQGCPTRKVHVLRCLGDDPMTDKWEFAGTLATDPVGIDGTVIQNRGQLYFVYAAYLNFPVTTRTDLYIYRMSDPLTVVGDPVCICKSEYDWEINAYHPEWKITEGAAALYRNGKIFLAYSANTVSYDYAIGLLTIDDDADLMNPANWKKSPEPVFRTKAEYHVYGPGHNSFTTSPDGSEDWLVYHCMYAPVPHPSRGGRRDACISKITWREDGTPDFGEPTPMYTDLAAPAGE